MPAKKTERGRMKTKEFFQLIPAPTLQRKNMKYRYRNVIIRMKYIEFERKIWYFTGSSCIDSQIQASFEQGEAEGIRDSWL